MKDQESNFEKLGVVYRDGVLQFAVHIQEDVPVSLLLYKKGSSVVEREMPFPEKKAVGDIYLLQVTDVNPERYEYNYKVNGEIMQDPCAYVLRGEKQFGVEVLNEDGHQIRCGFDREAYDWQNDMHPDIPYEDVVMYLLHVRGFTMQANSKVRHKGTFQGIAEKADYLKELGVNQVKLMPAYEFDEIMKPEPALTQSYMIKKPAAPEQPKVNYWGYVRGYYFAPNRAYASGKDPVKEFKDMVRILHSRGIEVIMEFYFPAECNPREITSCLLYWMQEYRVDGFHLLGDQKLFHYLAKDPVFSKIKLIGLYFPPEEIYGEKKLPKVRNLAEFNDGFLINMRKLLKGDEGQLNDFVCLIRKNPAGCGVINYLTNHEGFTLMDLVSYEEKHNEANGEHNQDGSACNYSWNCGIEGPSRRKKIQELRIRQMRNAFLLLLLSQGTPMLVSGDEFGNSQQGNNNPYCQDNETAWVDWKAAKKYAELTGFVKETIAFRKRHKILHMPMELRVMDSLSCGYPDVSYHCNRAWYGAFENVNRQIGVMYCGEYAGEDNFIYVAYNLHWMPHEFALPNLKEALSWYIAIDSGKGVYPEGGEPKLEEQKLFTVPERTIIVLVGRK